ncbi:MAG: DUF6270 domain-containing protein [Alicyclobacillus herbarius]|uniref:DUF6270 domain-containing protein n=1 Tax=Alicyclobacillus herbarius TaxID=122960 RepID=UPI00047EEC34|nr:DUF6270 domain-containing protein [Alicyclobacillus herbarius]MCL6633659.1 DUF6270 domain-containing protein [Alicyclobacillus herbarius]
MKIAVLGSCVTRDAFNSKFNPDYKAYYECGLTQNQSSIISLMTPEIPYDPQLIDNLSPYDTWNVRTEFTKEFLKLIRDYDPDCLLIDFFGDIHFGCICLGDDRFITNNRWKVWKTTFYKNLKQDNRLHVINIDEDAESYFKLWTVYADKLFEYLRTVVPGCRIVIHQARNVDFYMSNDGDLKRLSSSGKVKRINVDTYNEMWSRMDEYAIIRHGVESLDLFHDDNTAYTSFEAHPWGPFYVHYTMDYYVRFLDCLGQLLGHPALPR